LANKRQSGQLEFPPDNFTPGSIIPGVRDATRSLITPLAPESNGARMGLRIYFVSKNFTRRSRRGADGDPGSRSAMGYRVRIEPLWRETAGGSDVAARL